MPELKTDTIGESDIDTYIDTCSDFAFELKVLKTLHAHAFVCEHGGTYDDPVTQRPREFDIRATKDIGRFRIRLAVECKNIGANFPLLIVCLRRRLMESFHEVVHSFSPATRIQSPAKVIRLSGAQSIYKPNELVGKSSARVGRIKKGGFYDNDKDVYERWAQALGSAQDLVDRACYDGEEEGVEYVSMILPVLVIPDETLWLAEFDTDGSKIGNSRQAERCSYFIDKFYFGGHKAYGVNYQISHLEFVTLTGLVNLVSEVFSENAVRLMLRQYLDGNA
jgi:hypothetical protein